METSLSRKILITTVAWAVALLLFFPIFWMLLTSFKTETDAIASPPQLFFTPPSPATSKSRSAPTTSGLPGTAS